MTKRICITVTVLVVGTLVIIGAWMLAGRGEPAAPVPAEEAASEPAPVEEPVVEEAPSEPAPVEAVEEVEEVTIDVDDEIALTLPETEDVGGSLMRLPESLEPEILDERCAEIIAEMEKRQGKDKIASMKCTSEIDMGELGTMTSNLIFVPPMKMVNEITMKMGETTMRQYVVTDGVFMEIGMIGEDGTRKPMKFGDYDPSSTMTGAFAFGGGRFTEAVDIKADPTDAFFQKADGTPLDNLDLVVLHGEQADMPFELYVDPSNYQFVAMRMYKGDALFMELSQVEHADIGEGIIYPVAYNIHIDTAAAGQPGGPEMYMRVKMKDFVLNDPVDDSTFHFSSKME